MSIAEQREAKFRILDSLVARSLESLRPKLEFCGVQIPFGPNMVLWENSQALGEQDLDEFVRSINPKDLTPEELDRLGLAYEFVWAVEPPMAVIQRKEEVRAMRDLGKELSDIQKLWLNVSAVDTDSF